MKKSLSLSILFCLAFVTLGAQSNSKKSNKDDRADPKLIQELRTSCKDLLKNVPNPNDPKLTFPTSQKAQLNKFRSALNEGSRLPGNSKMRRVEKVFENLAAGLPKAGGGAGKGVSSYANKDKPGEGDESPLDKCLKALKDCKSSCSLSCYKCDMEFYKCSRGIRQQAWIKVYNGQFKLNKKPTSPPPTKG